MGMNRLRPPSALWLLIVLAIGLACGPGKQRKASGRGGDAAATTNNPIDTVVLPRLSTSGLSVEQPDRIELCRRLAVDILGRTADEKEAARCREVSTAEIVDAWLATPDHVLAERRYWASLMDLRGGGQWAAGVEDLDALVGRLASDELRYDAFATEVVVHPAFYERHPDTDWIRSMYDVFLGRTARPEEVDDLAPLMAVWSERMLVTRARDAEVFEMGFSGCRCGSERCVSDALGQAVDFRIECPDQPENKRASSQRAALYGGRVYGEADPGMVRLIDVTGGADGNRAGYVDAAGRRIEPLPLASDQQRKMLHGLGAALSARLDFYEAAVDREMHRLLGWWQTSFNQPDTDLPAVRLALAEQLRETGSLRQLKRTILTSALYTMPSHREDSASAPAWSAGPRKLLPVEIWLDAAARGTGRKLPRCDHRDIGWSEYYGEEGLVGFDDYIDSYDRRRRKKDPPFDFLLAARSLGGDCRHTANPRPSIGALEAQREVAIRLCAEGESVLPADFDPRGGPAGLEGAADHLVRRLLQRTSEPEELELYRKDMQGCLRRRERGCPTPEHAVRWTCVRLLLSAEFATY